MPACSRCSTTPSPRCVQRSTHSRTGGRPETSPGQYRLDLAADAAALPVLHGAGLAVLSEESGVTGERHLRPARRDRPRRRLDQRAPGRALLRHEHLRARRRGAPRRASSPTRRRGSGMPPCGAAARKRTAVVSSRRAAKNSAAPSWASRASRATTRAGPSSGRSGAASLECCAVAEGVLDAYMVVGPQHALRLGLSRRAADLPRGGCGGGGARRQGPGGTGRIEPAARSWRRPRHSRPDSRMRSGL